jgi:thiol-disulfide isomerase/thioredoxin
MQAVSRRRASIATIAPLLAFAVLATACAGPRSGTGNGEAAQLLPTSAAALPALDFDRYQRLIHQQEGTPVVVNIWASWCGPCRQEAPVLSAAARTYVGRVRFLGVDILDDRGSARSFIQEFGWPYPSVFDASGEIRDRLGIVGQPATLFYDASGNLVDKWIGAIPQNELTARVERLLGS